MSIDTLRFEDFIITFSHEGIYLDEESIQKMDVKVGSIIKIELYYHDRYLVSECYSIVKSKKTYNIKKEVKNTGNSLYLKDYYREFLSNNKCVILGYMEWVQLKTRLDRSERKIQTMKPHLFLSKIGGVSKCVEAKVRITNIKYPDDKINMALLEYPKVVKKGMEFPIFSYKDKKRKFNNRKTSLTRLTNVGPFRKELLEKNNINNILELINTPREKLENLQGISNKLVTQWLFESSKNLELLHDILSAKIFTIKTVSKRPESDVILIDRTSKFNVITPFYAEYSVREHPIVDSNFLDGLSEKLGNYYNISMHPGNIIELEKKDGTIEVKIYGPWILEMLGFNDVNEAREFLDDFEDVLMDTYQLYYDNDYIRLIDPQKNNIDPDQLLDSLIKKSTLPSFIIKDLFLDDERKLIIDTCVLIDERISYIFMKARQGAYGSGYVSYKPSVIIPNIVTFEIKSMLDRKRPKRFQYEYANRELMRLRALHDLGYIEIEHIGETPLIPPIVQQQDNKTWTFMGSLRDEYILKILKEFKNSILISSDKGLATSAYIRGYDVLYMEPLDKLLNDKLSNYDLNSLDEGAKEVLINTLSYELEVPKTRLMENIS